MYGLIVRFDLKDEAAAERFDQLAADTIAGVTAHEPNALVYAMHRPEDAPLSRIFYELYRDRADFEAHERHPHTRRLLDSLDDLVESRRFEFVQPIAAKGLPTD